MWVAIRRCWARFCAWFGQIEFADLLSQREIRDDSISQLEREKRDAVLALEQELSQERCTRIKALEDLVACQSSLVRAEALAGELQIELRIVKERNDDLRCRVASLLLEKTVLENANAELGDLNRQLLQSAVVSTKTTPRTSGRENGRGARKRGPSSNGGE